MEEQLAELGIFAALALGIVLGLKHSLDPDHVVAVSTIVSEYRNPLRSFWVGVSWGLGPTTTLLLIGAIYLTMGGAARVFRIGILMTGKPPKLMEIIRWLRIDPAVNPSTMEEDS